MPTASMQTSAEYADPNRGKRLATDGGRIESASAAVPMEVPNEIPRQVSTEMGVTVFGTMAGFGAFVAQVLGARRLSQVEGDSVALSSLLMPALILIAGVVVASRFIPTS